MDSSPQELELTPELLAYAQAVALTEAKKHCAQRDLYDDRNIWGTSGDSDFSGVNLLDEQHGSLYIDIT